jgi:hypothetical protein
MQREGDLRRKALSDIDRAEAWYICTAFANETVTRELSRPEGVIDKQFSGFGERIFILSEGDAGLSKLINLDHDTPPLVSSGRGAAGYC